MNRESIESIVPLLPVQQHFLWHSLSHEASTSLIQLRCTLSGHINLVLLENAWSATLAQHQAMRSSVHWKTVTAPIQVVHKQADSRWTIVDRLNFADMDVYAAHDRHQALDLSKAGAFRLAIYPRGSSACDILWTMSHVLLDGWSSALVINDWVQCYTQLLNGNAPPTINNLPLSDYTRWLKQQDQEALRRYWDDYLPTIFNTSALPHEKPVAEHAGNRIDANCSVEITAQDYQKLTQMLTACNLSLGTALQGAFGTVLHCKDNPDPMVFASTVAGRHISLQGIEQRVGMLSNTVPVCVPFSPSATVESWLSLLQERFFASLPYTHVSAVELASLRPDYPVRLRSLLVLENQPTVISTPAVTITDFRSDIVSNFDLTLVVVPAETLTLHLRFNESRFDAVAMRRWLQSLNDLLSTLPALIHQPLESLDRYKVDADNSTRHSKVSDHAVLAATAFDDYRDHAATAFDYRDQAAPVFDHSGHSQTEHTEGSAIADTSTHASSDCAIDSSRDTRACAANADFTPTTLLAHQVHTIWCQVLGMDNIPPERSFFDSGGSSLQAVMLFERLEHKLGIRLPATTLFEAPSQEALLKLIENGQPDTSLTSVVVVNPQGKKIPLFIPFEQADMLMYQPLFSELGADQPIYGLQIPQNELLNSSQRNEMVTHIRSIQSTGPYRLAGLSSAGVVALDLAQRLKAQDCDVDWLILFDSYGPDYPHLQAPAARLFSVGIDTAWQCLRTSKKVCKKVWQKCRSSFPTGDETPTPNLSMASGNALQLAKRQQFSAAFAHRIDAEIALTTRLVSEAALDDSRWASIANQLTLRLSLLRFGAVLLRIEFIAFTQGLLLEVCRRQVARSRNVPLSSIRAADVLTLNPGSLGDVKPVTQQMLTRFQGMYAHLQPYSGRILYCRAENRPAGTIEDPLTGWGSLLEADVIVEMIPGDHMSLLKPPHVRILGQRLLRQLNEANPASALCHCSGQERGDSF